MLDLTSSDAYVFTHGTGYSEVKMYFMQGGGADIFTHMAALDAYRHHQTETAPPPAHLPGNVQVGERIGRYGRLRGYSSYDR